MISFNLKCKRDHVFEGWFQDGAAFEAQIAEKSLSCPVCGSTKVEKSLMAPALSGSKKKSDATPPPMSHKAMMETEQAAEARQALAKLRETVEKNFDYVGPEFAEEARKIHYGEEDARNIYGETSDEEAKALEEEGVEVQRIPWLPRENS